MRAVAMREASGGGEMRFGTMPRSQSFDGVGSVCVRRADWSWVAKSGGGIFIYSVGLFLFLIFIS